MQKFSFIILISLFAISSSVAQTYEAVNSKMPTIKFEYPETRKDSTNYELWGTTIQEPYGWLENDTAADTEDWVQRQNAVTNDFLNKVPFRKAIEDRYAELFDFPKVSSPQRVGENYFFYKNSGLQDQSVIYIQKGRDGQPEVFIDPNELSEDGTITVNLMGASRDKKYIAIMRNEAGSDWGEIRIWDIEARKELDEQIKWVKFSGASWKGNGFYYSRYPEPEEGTELSATNTFHKVYYHEIGTPQEQDELFYENEGTPNMYHSVGISEDEKYLMLYASTGTDGFEMYFKDMENDGPLTVLVPGFETKTSLVEHKNGKFLVMTDIDAPNYRLVAVDPANPAQENWTEIIPERDDLLQGVSTGGGKMFATYLKDVTTRIYQMDYDGSNKKEIELPGLGSAGGLGGWEDENEMFYSFTSFTDPGTIYEYNVEKGTSEVFYRTELKFDPEKYETKQVFYPSKDGTKIPMFIVHKKGLVLDGTNPTLLYAYGGFNISLSPWFSTSRMILLENGGVFALANLRGGGEYGEDWHKAGMEENKQNVFDDFISAAEYLIDEKYTSSDKLAIQGGSNGGLLVGAVIAQRPELFQVAFPAVGVMDMLKYHKFTVGWGWIPEYGCADSSKTQFDYLHAYSPLHNLKDGTDYPATMITTADHDDRVVPAHSFKFAARLQEAHSGDRPVMIRIEEKAGHGAGKPTSKIIEEQADQWAFFFYNMGVTPEYVVETENAETEETID